MPALMNTPESGNKKVAQNILVAQEVAQKLEALGYLESLQESEIENISETQVVDSSVVYRVLAGKIESALDGNRTCNLRFRRPMLYPVELQVHLSNAMNIGLKSPEVNARVLYVGMKPAVNAGKAELIRGVDDSVICTDWNDF